MTDETVSLLRARADEMEDEARQALVAILDAFESLEAENRSLRWKIFLSHRPQLYEAVASPEMSMEEVLVLMMMFAMCSAATIFLLCVLNVFFVHIT